jgi:Protein of unknown function (DUF1524)
MCAPLSVRHALRACVLGLALLLSIASASAAAPAATDPGVRLQRLLDRATVVAEPGYHEGYDRDCDPGGCVFGREWTDKNPTRFGHNGCDTRQDVLLEQMTHIEMRWGSECEIYQARLRDPYTGLRMNWRDDGYNIQVDHVYPLARAWHEGAWAWTRKQRVAFANDVDLELLAVSGRANQDKEDSTPAEWMPPRRAFGCDYLVAYLRVAAAYDLPITQADADLVAATIPSC